MVYTFVIPAPETLLEYAWFAMGITFGRGFGKQLDQDIQSSKWFKKRGYWTQWLLKRVLDVTHHWEIGILMVLYIPTVEVIWFGWGLVVDDLPDIPARFGIDMIENRLYGNEEPITP